MLGNTAHMAIGQVGLSSTTDVRHGLAILVRWQTWLELHWCKANMEGQLRKIWDCLHVCNFHESGTMSYALQRLAHNAVDACAQLQAQFRGHLCQKSFPMMRPLFDALVLPTVSYGSEVWGPFCSPTLPRDFKKMADVPIAFFWQLCRLKRRVTPAIIFGNCLKCHGCIGGGTRSLASCIACPTCLRTAFMLRLSGTTLLMPRNTPHMATGLVALSSSTAALAWSRRFRLLA